MRVSASGLFVKFSSLSPHILFLFFFDISAFSYFFPPFFLIDLYNPARGQLGRWSRQWPYHLEVLTMHTKLGQWDMLARNLAPFRGNREPHHCSQGTGQCSRSQDPNQIEAWGG